MLGKRWVDAQRFLGLYRPQFDGKEQDDYCLVGRPRQREVPTVKVGIAATTDSYNLSVYELSRNEGYIFGYYMPCASYSFNLLRTLTYT